MDFDGSLWSIIFTHFFQWKQVNLGALSHPTINISEWIWLVFHISAVTFMAEHCHFDANQTADGGGRERSGGDCDWPHLGTHRRAVADPQSHRFQLQPPLQPWFSLVKSLNLSGKKSPIFGWHESNILISESTHLYTIYPPYFHRLSLPSLPILILRYPAWWTATFCHGKSPCYPGASFL